MNVGHPAHAALGGTVSHHDGLQRALAWVAHRISGRERVGGDPFLSDPVVFFDVIQRRRNRNGASFCYGAASFHRREAVFLTGLCVTKRTWCVPTLKLLLCRL